MRDYKYISRENRDREAARQRAQGRSVQKRSARNVTLSPDYVADFDGTPIPNGFGGSAAQYFPVLYILVIR
jgi:hypothetical protein